MLSVSTSRVRLGQDRLSECWGLGLFVCVSGIIGLRKSHVNQKSVPPYEI